MDERPARSDFITALAWVFIAVGALKLALGFIHLAILGTALYGMAWKAPLPRPGVPPWVAFSLEHAPEMAAAGCALALLTLAAGAGLLLRKEWARRLLVAVLAVGIARSAFGILVQGALYARMPPPPIGDPWTRYALVVFAVASLAVSTGFAALYAWLIVRLHSPDARAEFQDPEAQRISR